MVVKFPNKAINSSHSTPSELVGVSLKLKTESINNCVICGRNITKTMLRKLSKMPKTIFFVLGLRYFFINAFFVINYIITHFFEKTIYFLHFFIFFNYF